MSASSVPWYQILISVVSGVWVGGLLQAVPSAIRAIRRPRLRIYVDDEKCHFYRGLAQAGENPGHWLGLWVENRPVMGRAGAVDSFVELIEVERVDANGKAIAEPAFVPDRLPWAGMGERAYQKLDVYPGLPRRVSLCVKSSAGPGALFWETQPTAMPSGRPFTFPAGTYRVRVRVYWPPTSHSDGVFLVDHGVTFEDLTIRPQ